jgi:hypothetical protein
MKSVWGILALALASTSACSSSSSKTPTTCDASCQDEVAVRGLRNAVKLAYNLLLQGGPVGMQDKMAPCPLGGTVHVQGTATSVAEQGTTMVDLTYDFAACGYSETDTDPTKTFSLTFTGTVSEKGNLANDPSSTTALTFHSDSMTLKGTVFSPTVDYDDESCALDLSQSGDNVSGTLCTRMTGISL